MKDIEEKNHLILNLIKQVKSIGYQLSTVPNDVNLVHKTGDETIDGIKTFLKVLVAPGYSIPSGTPLQFLTADGAFFTYQTGPEDTFYKTDDIATHSTSSVFYPSTKAVVDYVNSVSGSLIRDEFNYSGSQTFTTTFPFGQVYEVIIQGITASQSQYTLTAPDQVTILDPLDPGDYIVIVYSQTNTVFNPYYTQAQTDALLNLKEDKANKQLTPLFDGTGLKYPALDLMNDNFLINTKLFSRTGIANKKDGFELVALNTTTLRIKQCDTVVFWEELFEPFVISYDALRVFPELDYPLIQLVTPTGGNININPITTPGLYVRYIGYDVDGHVISDSSDFSTNNSVAQLGVITVVYNSGVVSFLDMIPNGRNVFSQPILANTNDLQRANFVPTTSVTIGYDVGTPTIHSNDGVINGISINWRGINNAGNSLPVDRYAYTGVTPLPFVSIDASFLTSTSPLVTHTLWTDVVSGVAINSSFWNTTTSTRQAMLANSYGIKQVVMGVRGGFFIQDPEFATNACYSTLALAQANVYTHKFTDAVVPNTIAMSVARIIYKQGVTNFSDPLQFQIVPTGLGSGSGGGVVPPVADATTVSKGIVQLAGDLAGTADAPTVVSASGSSGLFTIKVPSEIIGTSLTDSSQLGAELMTTANANTDWTGSSYATGYTHIVGNTTTLQSPAVFANAGSYYLVITITGRTAGSVSLGIGIKTLSTVTASTTWGVRPTAAAILNISPTTDFDGTIVVSAKSVTDSGSILTMKDSASTIINEIRGSAISTFIGKGSGAKVLSTTLGNTGIGVSALGGNISGLDNTAVGYRSLATLDGHRNTAVGSSTTISLTGDENTAVGYRALSHTSTASNMVRRNNVALGAYAAAIATTSGTITGMTAIGSYALYTGSNYSVGVGYQAGRFIADGVTESSSPNNSVFIGSNTRSKAIFSTNEIVIGDSAIGRGNNTTTIGASTITSATIYGNLITGASVGTNIATHPITLGSVDTGNGIALYNTTDQTTNYERLRIYANTNTYRIGSENGGTGTLRDILLLAGNVASSSFAIKGVAGIKGKYEMFYSTSNNLDSTLGLTGTLSASTGTQNCISLLPTINQSSTAGYRCYWASPYEQTTGSGTKLLMDLGTNSAANGGGTHTSVFSVTNTGLVTSLGGLKYTKAMIVGAGTTDLNTITDAGFYQCYSTSANAPTSTGDYYLTVERDVTSNLYVHQIATSFGNGNTGNKIYSRVKISGTWGAWSEILTTTTTANLVITTNVQTGTTYTIVASDLGKQLIFTSSSPITVTIPTGLGTGFNCEVLQQGTGQITFVASSTTLKYSTYELPTTYEQYSIVAIDNMPNLTETYHLFGQLTSI